MNLKKIVALCDDLCLQNERGSTAAEIIENSSIVLGNTYGISMTDIEALDSLRDETYALQLGQTSSNSEELDDFYETIESCGIKMYTILRKLLTPHSDTLLEVLKLRLLAVRCIEVGVTGQKSRFENDLTYDTSRIQILRCYVRTALKFQDLNETEIEEKCLRWGENTISLLDSMKLIRAEMGMSREAEDVIIDLFKASMRLSEIEIGYLEETFKSGTKMTQFDHSNTAKTTNRVYFRWQSAHEVLRSQELVVLSLKFMKIVSEFQISLRERGKTTNIEEKQNEIDDLIFVADIQARLNKYPEAIKSLNQTQSLRKETNEKYSRYSGFKAIIVKFYIALKYVPTCSDSAELHADTLLNLDNVDPNSYDNLKVALDTFEEALTYCTETLQLDNEKEREAALASLIACSNSFCRESQYSENSISCTYFRLEETFAAYDKESGSDEEYVKLHETRLCEGLIDLLKDLLSFQDSKARSHVAWMAILQRLRRYREYIVGEDKHTMCKILWTRICMEYKEQDWVSSKMSTEYLLDFITGNGNTNISDSKIRLKAELALAYLIVKEEVQSDKNLERALTLVESVVAIVVKEKKEIGVDESTNHTDIATEKYLCQLRLEKDDHHGTILHVALSLKCQIMVKLRRNLEDVTSQMKELMRLNPEFSMSCFAEVCHEAKRLGSYDVAIQFLRNWIIEFPYLQPGKKNPAISLQNQGHSNAATKTSILFQLTHQIVDMQLNKEGISATDILFYSKISKSDIEGATIHHESDSMDALFSSENVKSRSILEEILKDIMRSSNIYVNASTNHEYQTTWKTMSSEEKRSSKWLELFCWNIAVMIIKNLKWHKAEEYCAAIKQCSSYLLASARFGSVNVDHVATSDEVSESATPAKLGSSNEEENEVQIACAYTSSLCCITDLILKDIIESKLLDTDSVMMSNFKRDKHLNDMLTQAEEMVNEIQIRSPKTCNSAVFWSTKLVICLFQLRAKSGSIKTVDHLSIAKKIINDIENISSRSLIDLAILCKAFGAFDSAKCLFNKIVQIQCAKHRPDLAMVSHILIELIKLSKCNEETLSFLDTAYHLFQNQSSGLSKKSFPTPAMHYLAIILWNIGVDQNTKAKRQEVVSKHLKRSLDMLKRCGELDPSVQRKYEKLLKTFQDWQTDLADNECANSNPAA